MGLVADVANRKRLLMAGIAVWSAATLASGLAESFGQLFAARLFIGIGASSGPLLVAYVTEQVFGSDRAVGWSIAIVGTLAFAACALFALIAARNLRA